MAYYAYKAVLNLLPEEYIKKYDPDGLGMDCGYDGELYCAAADYIEDLQKQVAELEAKLVEQG